MRDPVISGLLFWIWNRFFGSRIVVYGLVFIVQGSFWLGLCFRGGLGRVSRGGRKGVRKGIAKREGCFGFQESRVRSQESRLKI